MTEADMISLMEGDIERLMSNPISVEMFATERNVLDRPDIDRRAEYQRFMKNAILAHLSGARGLENRTPEQYAEAISILRKYMHIFVDNVTDRIGCLDYLQDGYNIVDEALSKYKPEGPRRLYNNSDERKLHGYNFESLGKNDKPEVKTEHIEKAEEIMDQFFERFGKSMPYITQLWKQNKDLVKQMVYDRFGISRKSLDQSNQYD